MKDDDRSHKFVVAVFAGLTCILLLASVLSDIGGPFGGPSKTSGIVYNLRQLDEAKMQWALEHGPTVSVTPTREDIGPYLKYPPNFGGWVRPVAEEQYNLRKFTATPEAVLTRPLEGRPKGTVIRLSTNGAAEIILPVEKK